MGCAAARMSEGILHVAPPFITTDDEIDFIAETVDKVLHRMENAIAQLPAK
jgi:adenosylmethionine-8-amino-7-oxononanoate aminotransferase